MIKKTVISNAVRELLRRYTTAVHIRMT